MTQTDTSPLTPHGADDKTDDLSDAIPVLTHVVTLLGRPYELHAPFPQLPGLDGKPVSNPYAGTVRRITEVTERSDDPTDEGERVFYVRVEPTGKHALEPGESYLARIMGDQVVMTAAHLPAARIDEIEAAAEAKTGTGLDVLRVVMPLGAMAMVYEVGSKVPSFPAPYQLVRGTVKRITRMEDGRMFVRVLPPGDHPVLGGMGEIAVEIFTYHDSLEIMKTDEIEAIEQQAEQEMLDALAGDDDDAEGDGDEAPDATPGKPAPGAPSPPGHPTGD